MGLGSQRFIRACSDFLAIPGFTPHERRAVEFARAVLRVAASQREEIIEPNVKGMPISRRRRRHAEAARALQASLAAVDEADAVLDEALEAMAADDHSPHTWKKDLITERGLK